MKIAWRRPGIVALFAGCAVILLSGCGEERNYAVPDELCGVRVSPKAVEPFLPPGEDLKVKEDHYGSNTGVEGCTAYVDGHVVLSSRGEWRAERLSAKEAASVPGPWPFAGGRYVWWERGAATVLACHAPDQDTISRDEGKGDARYFALEAQVPKPDKGTPEAMRTFLVEYARAYAKTLPCQK
jgi:hypothetical protein